PSARDHISSRPIRLIKRPPPTSTLSPYTTLFRSDLVALRVPQPKVIDQRPRVASAAYHAVAPRHRAVVGYQASGQIHSAYAAREDHKRTPLNSNHDHISYSVY